MSNQIKLNYRPEIDGLRAIAVLSVIIYHLEIFFVGEKILTGGFLGVDIFFVISGYLITLLIAKEFLKEQKISLSNFYFRRAKRILPALLFMIIITIFFAWTYLTPNNFLQYSNSIFSSILFYSNYFFYFSDLVYNSQNSLLKPLLHTWSLAVEEQFYILFPLFFIFIYKFIKKKLIISFLYILIIFFFLAVLITASNSSLGFYSNFSRMWEILFGSILAILEIKEKKIYFKFEKILPTFGLLLIIFSLFYFDNNTIHPSFLTLIPIIGVFLIIHFINSNNLIFKILTFKVFSKIGLWSYSLYLWHFPIFAFARNRGKSLSDFDKLELLGLTFILSIFSYYLIEKPFRKISYKHYKKFFIFISLILIFLCTFSFYSKKNNGFEDRVHVFLKNSMRENLWEKVSDESGPCFDRIKNYCNFNKNQKQRILLIGDSHSELLSFSLLNNFKQKYNFISMNRGSCIYLPNVEKKTIKENKEFHNCTIDSKIKIEKEINRKSNSIIILGGNFKEHFFTKYDWKYIASENISIEESFKKSVLNLLRNNKVILIYPIPSLNFNLQKRIMNELPKSTFKATYYLEKNPYTTDYKMYLNENDKILNFFNKIKHKNLIKIFPDEIFCNKSENICFSHEGKNLYYSDPQHLSLSGSEMISNKIFDEIKKITLNKDLF